MFVHTDMLIDIGRSTIELDGTCVTLILEWPSGMTYTAQTHGIACYHPTMQGVAVPLNWPQDIPHDGCWGDWQNAPALADWIDARAEGAFHVDRPRMTDRDYGEAWIPVVLPTGQRGVLTYQNCD